MTAVTRMRKCYVVPCVVCRTLYPTYRTDSRTCSPACRVALHRGAVDTYKAAAEAASAPGEPVEPFDVRRAAAVEALRPDLLDGLLGGRVTLDDVAAEVWGTFWDLVVEGGES